MSGQAERAGLGLAEPNVIVTVEFDGTAGTDKVPARLNAAESMPHRLGLTGARVGCEQGVCGMCTVLVDGEAVKSCLMLTAQLDGRRVQTVESLATDGALSPVQECFKQDHALQCGFCTPGFLMTATALAASERKRSRAEIREELAGVLCRCTGYEFIVNAGEAYLAAERKSADD